MLNSSIRSRKRHVEPSAPSVLLRCQMARFGFSIRTRGGVLIENLSIPGLDAEEAERKLRQIYVGCSVIARSVPEPALASGPHR